MAAKKTDKMVGELKITSQYGIKITKKNIIQLKCPNCLLNKPIDDFGFRSMGKSVYRNQPWCTECRNASK